MVGNLSKGRKPWIKTPVLWDRGFCNRLVTSSSLRWLLIILKNCGLMFEDWMGQQAQRLWWWWCWTKCFKEFTAKNLIISHLAKESASLLMSLRVHYCVHKWSLLDPNLSQIKRRHWPPKSTIKPTHTGWYLNFDSKHPPHMKRSDSEGLHNTASTICQEQQDLKSAIVPKEKYWLLPETVVKFVYTSSKFHILTTEEIGPSCTHYIEVGLDLKIVTF
jgi:hypothetical protein